LTTSDRFAKLPPSFPILLFVELKLIIIKMGSVLCNKCRDKSHKEKLDLRFDDSDEESMIIARDLLSSFKSMYTSKSEFNDGEGSTTRSTGILDVTSFIDDIRDEENLSKW
jgi:hypothetical protein